jgi:beta-galactosidase beta subunit
MFISNKIHDFASQLPQRQLDIVKKFFANQIDWTLVKHGDKKQLEENISVVFLAANGTNDYLNVLEAHKKMYDLHCILEGNDIIVSKPVADCINIKTAYTEEGDYVLYHELPVDTYTAEAGSFFLIPPADAHMALYGDCGFVRKVVFKIPVA